MPHYLHFRAAQATCAGWLLLAVLAASAQAPAELEPLVPDTAIASASAAIWAVPISDEPGRYARIELAAVEVRPWDAVLDLNGVIVSAVVQHSTVLHLQLIDEAGGLHSEASMRLPLEVGANSFTFSILPEVLPSGQYEARFRAVADEFHLLAEATMAVRKLDGRILNRQISEIEARVASIRQHLDDHAGAYRYPYERMRLAAVEQLLPASRRMMAGHALLRADDIIRYMAGTLDSVRATLTFGDPAEREAGDALRPDMATVVPRDGAFYAGTEPVFLLGFAGGDHLVKDLGLLSRLGLNFALVTQANGSTHAESKALSTADRLRPVVEQATRHNVALSVQLSLSPEANFPRAAEAMPGLYTLWPEGAPISPGEPHWFLSGAVRWLGNQPIVHSVGIANRPVIRFRGEEARRAFVDSLRHIYPTQYDLNRSWKMRVRSFDEVQIMPTSDRIAYQHDWHRFSRDMGARYAAGFIGQMRASAPSLPVYLKYDGALFGPEAPAAHIDHEALREVTPITGVTSRLGRAHPQYALDYPGHILSYAYLRSVAPRQPLLDAELHLDLDTDGQHAPGTSEDFVHAGMWDAAIEGLNGAALWAWTRDADAIEAAPGNLVEELGALEGLARASLDLNRLGRIVVALQQAPADVAILYSFDSLIRPEATDHLTSLQAAFEGVSFGGRKVRFLTEQQAAAGELSGVRVLVLPKVRALPDDAFAAVSDYIERGGVVIRTPNQIPYDGRGHSRRAVLVSTLQTILVRGLDTPASYFHAIEAAYSTGLLPEVPRPSNEYGYLLQGVKSRFVELDGQGYLYLLNLRKDPVRCGLNGPYESGHDLIQGRDMSFPAVLTPLDPMLIRLDPAEQNRVVIADRVAAP